MLLLVLAAPARAYFPWQWALLGDVLLVLVCVALYRRAQERQMRRPAGGHPKR
jgi:membrane protein implicated in regulation of membrane protease activity